MAGVKKEKKRN